MNKKQSWVEMCFCKEFIDTGKCEHASKPSLTCQCSQYFTPIDKDGKCASCKLLRSEKTCLEEAKKENDLTEIELCRARTLEQHWYHKYSKLQMRSLYYLLAVALIAFVGGIWFTWERMGEPKTAEWPHMHIVSGIYKVDSVERPVVRRVEECGRNPIASYDTSWFSPDSGYAGFANFSCF